MCFPSDGDRQDRIRTARECYGALLGNLASAQAAVAACLAVREGATTVAKWTRQAVGAWNGESVAVASPLQVPWTHNPEPAAIVRQAFAALQAQTGCRIGAALDMSLSLLGKFRVVRQRKIPVLGYNDTKGAFVAWLTVELLEHGTGEFYRDPNRMSFQAITSKFLTGVELAHRAALTDPQAQFSNDFDIRWSVEGDDLKLLDGGSLGAGMAVALVQLLRNEPLDATCAITAEIDGEGNMGPVRFVGEKVAKALEKGVLRIIVHPANEAEAAQAARNCNRDPDEVVQVATNLHEACEKSSGLVQGLCEYFERLIARPDREEQLPIYMGGRKRTELYVEPDVLKRVVKPRRDDETRSEETGDRKESSPVERLATEARDIGEDAIYGEREEESVQRVSWRGEWEAQRHGAAAWRSVLLGPPGQGKSLLAEMTVRQIAADVRDALLNGQRRLDTVPLPIILRLNDVANAISQSQGDVEEGIRQALIQQFGESGMRAEVAGYLAGHVREARCWLLLDALDEVEQPAALQPLLAAIGQWNCRVLITSRRMATPRIAIACRSR